MPPTVLMAAALLMLGLHFLSPVTQIVTGLWRLMGLLPLGLGLAINVVADKQFHQVDTTVRPFEQSNRLVMDGLYRFSRNPMYLGMVVVLVGVALLLGSLTPFGVIPAFIGWIQIQFIRHEEQKLSTQFGQDWLEYKARVHRWI